MNRRLLVLIITGLLLLLAVPLVEAGCGCPPPFPPVDDVDTFFDCETLSVSWSHDSGIISAILVVDLNTFQPIVQQIFNGPSGNVSVDFDPALSQSTVLGIIVIVTDSLGNPYMSEYEIDCLPEPQGCADGRLTSTLCQPLVIYPVNSEDGIGITIYKVSRGSDVGEFMLDIPAEVFDSLPETPAQNCTIDSSADGEIVVYHLTSGQYQVNIGPDEEGKVFAYIFDNWHSAPVSMDSYISGLKPEILPACN